MLRATLLGTALIAAGASIALAATLPVRIVGKAMLFAPNVASTAAADVRLTISPDGRRALWFSRDRSGGPGGYDIWEVRRTKDGWGEARPVPFNSPTRDFDPAFSSDGRHVYFCSDRPGAIGGDDLYRVTVTRDGFGAVEHLGTEVNSGANEFAPMLSAGGQLLFSSNRAGGAGKYDLYTARRVGRGFAVAKAVAGALNTAADEFDATFLADDATIIFSRAPDMQKDRVDLYQASFRGGRYGAGERFPLSVNDVEKDSYGPMLDWSKPSRFSFSGKRDGAASMELYLIEYRMSGRRFMPKPSWSRVPTTTSR